MGGIVGVENVGAWMERASACAESVAAREADSLQVGPSAGVGEVSVFQGRLGEGAERTVVSADARESGEE